MLLSSEKDLVDQIPLIKMAQKWATLKKKKRILIINKDNDEKCL
jgi:hypothetical protein